MPMIGDVDVIHLRRALLQTVIPRKDAMGRVVVILVNLLAFGGSLAAFLALPPGQWASPGGRAEAIVGGCVHAFIVLVSLPALVRYARIAIWGEVLTFSRETGTIERNGRFLARFAEVSCVEVRTIMWLNVEGRQLSIILKTHKRVRICEVWEAEARRAAQIELAKELGQMLGVGVTFP